MFLKFVPNLKKNIKNYLVLFIQLLKTKVCRLVINTMLGNPKSFNIVNMYCVILSFIRSVKFIRNQKKIQKEIENKLVCHDTIHNFNGTF